MDVAAMNAILDASFGTTRAAHCPSSHQLALFYGDPRDLGTELDATGGYARTTVAAADWLAAADGEKSTVTKTLATPTGEWSSEATHYALFDGSGYLWDSGPLTSALTVTGPGPAPQARITVRWADAVDPAA